MEATGPYWKPIWYVLEDRGFELKLVNAKHVKMVPGRKTDLADAAWLAELLEHGLLRSSFVPPAEIRELRDLTRYRKRLIQTHTAECQRVQKVLEDAGIKLDSVASDVLGVSGRAMLRALIYPAAARLPRQADHPGQPGRLLGCADRPDRPGDRIRLRSAERPGPVLHRGLGRGGAAGARHRRAGACAAPRRRVDWRRDLDLKRF
jgi:hypothetical protein